jgi:transcriptional regulator with XRE-family HTH domain
MDLILDLTNMKVSQSSALSSDLLAEAQKIGAMLARLRVARHIPQTEAALRAGISRNTAYRMEKGDPGLAIGQVLRYLEAIAPGKTLQSLLNEDDPALVALSVRERKQRVRSLSKSELDALDF